MSDIRVEKCYYDLNSNMDEFGKLTTARVPFIVFGANGEKDALDATFNASGEKLENLKRENIEVDERLSENIFRTIVNYDRDPFDSDSSGNLEPCFYFDTSGGTKHITQSLETVDSIPSDAPDYKGAIGVDDDGNVNGVDIAMPVMNFSETHYLRSSKVNTAYKKDLAAMTGTVNAKSFRGWEPGEVLFLGANGTRRGDNSKADWEISFRFAVSPKKENFHVGKLRIPCKAGWDYLWVRYASELSGNDNNLVKVPESAYIERVYDSADFGKLGIGR